MGTSKITNELIEGAVKCDHKVTQLLNHRTTEEKEYLRVQKVIKDLHRDRCLRILAKSGRLLDGLSTRNIHDANIGRETIYAIDFTIITETVDILFDAVAIKRIGRSAFAIETIFFSSKRRLDAEERRLITVRSLLAQEASGFHLKKAIVFRLNESEPTSIRMSARNADIRLIQKLKAIIAGQVSETHARTISHCKECVFEGVCQQELKVRDDLSLLSGMSENDIKAHQAKGVFTINQLSHTYRPRRRPNDSKPKFYPSLKAMAIREAKVYVTQPSIVPLEKVDVFYPSIRGTCGAIFANLEGASSRLKSRSSIKSGSSKMKGGSLPFSTSTTCHGTITTRKTQLRRLLSFGASLTVISRKTGSGIPWCY